jgi:hypothetical protein
MWPFRRHERAGRRGRHDPTSDIVSWTQRTLGEPGNGVTPVPDPLDRPEDLSDAAATPADWRSSVQDPWQNGWAPTHHEVATTREGDGAQAEPDTTIKEPDGGSAQAEPGTTIVVVTTQSSEASEGEAHIFADAQEAKLFVAHLIDDGFDRDCIKTIRGGQTQLRVSLRAVVDFD